MKKIKYILLALVISTLFIFSSCNSNRVSAPTNAEIDIDNILTWDKIEDARSYVINIKYVDSDEVKTEKVNKVTYDLSNLLEGDYEITLQSISGDKKKKDSKLTDVIYFQKLKETGCQYTLINNNTEYQVTKVGKAKGTFTIEDYYRGKAVTKIAEAAFRGSTNIVDVTIGNNVIEIGNNAFYNCSKLSRIVIPESVSTMGKTIFQSCRSLTNVEINANIDELPASTFAYCRSLVDIKIPETVTVLGNNCFQDCSALKNIVIGDKITTISESAFSGCTSLETVKIGKNVESIEKFAFYGCLALNNVEFSSNSSLKLISIQSFQGCAALPSITLPNGLEEIDNFAFYGCTELEEVSIPSTVKRVGQGVFTSTKLYTKQVEESNEFIYADKWLISAFSVRETLTEIKSSSLKAGTFGIADSVFIEFPELQTVELPETLKYIGTNAFRNCKKLWKIKLLEDSVVEIGDHAFRSCAITNITLNDGLKVIGSYAFYDNSQLDNNAYNAKTWIPDTVNRIGTYAFKGTALWTKAGNVSKGIVYAGNWVVGFTNELNYNVELEFDLDHTAGIADYAFYQDEFLTSIVGLNNCKYIGRGAFYECKNLSTVSLYRGLTEIRPYTFYKCEALIRVSLPKTIKLIDKYAFYECSRLMECEFENLDLEKIEKSAFYKTRLSNLNFGKSLKSIGDYAFYGVKTLQDVNISSGLQNLGTRAFASSSVKNVVISSSNDGKNETGLTEISPYAFANCTFLQTVKIGDSVKKIGKSAFYRATSLEKLELGSGVEWIDDYAFYNAENLKELILPESLDRIGNFAFKGLISLDSVFIPETITTIGQHAFYGCKYTTIYTNAKSIKPLWHERFNSSTRPTFYGVVLDGDGFVEKVIFDSEHVEYIKALNGICGPLKPGYTFKYFIDEENNQYKANDLYDLNKDCTLIAVYEKSDLE